MCSVYIVLYRQEHFALQSGNKFKEEYWAQWRVGKNTAAFFPLCEHLSNYRTPIPRMTCQEYKWANYEKREFPTFHFSDPCAYVVLSTPSLHYMPDPLKQFILAIITPASFRGFRFRMPRGAADKYPRTPYNSFEKRNKRMAVPTNYDVVSFGSLVARNLCQKIPRFPLNFLASKQNKPPHHKTPTAWLN